MGFKFSFFLLHDLSLHISNKSSDYNNKNSIASSNKGVLSYWKTDKVCFCCRCRITFVFLCPDLERFDTKTVNIGNSVFFAVFEQDPATSKGMNYRGRLPVGNNLSKDLKSMAQGPQAPSCLFINSSAKNAFKETGFPSAALVASQKDAVKRNIHTCVVFWRTFHVGWSADGLSKTESLLGRNVALSLRSSLV